jgi:hypothetical protein
MFMSIWNLYVVFIKSNDLNLDESYIILITNAWQAVNKIIILKNFLNKIKMKVM